LFAYGEHPRADLRTGFSAGKKGDP